MTSDARRQPTWSELVLPMTMRRPTIDFDLRVVVMIISRSNDEEAGNEDRDQSARRLWSVDEMQTEICSANRYLVLTHVHIPNRVTSYSSVESLEFVATQSL